MELFERERQMSLLEQALMDVRSGEGRLVLISGEAGIGKTTLTERFTSQHAGETTVYWGACDALFTPRPLGPFVDIALQMRPELLELIESSPDWYRAATSFLKELTERDRPVILVIEDVHWADEATLDMLKFLGRRIQHRSILMILTFRDDEISSQRLLPRLTADLPAKVTVRLALGPLSQTSVDQMAQRARRQMEGLYAVTGGNPFFVTQLLESETSEVPPSVRELVLARVSRLSPSSRELAEMAAIIPGGTAHWLVERICSNPAAALDECVEQGVLTSSPDGLAYRHELARRAVEDSLPPGRARQLHSKILRSLLEQYLDTPPLAQVIHHAVHAGDFANLLRYAPVAAQEASRLGAHREAAAHYRIVLNQLTSLMPETHAELLEGLSYECYLTGDLRTALQTRQQATTIWKSLQRADKEGNNMRWLSRLSWFAGQRKEAERYAHEAVDILEKLPPGFELAMAYSNISQLYMLSEMPEPAREWGEKAIALASKLEAEEIQVHARINLGVAELQLGEEIGWEHLTQALELARQRKLHEEAGRAYANLIWLSFRLRRIKQCEFWQEQGLAYMEEFGLDALRVHHLGGRARLYAETGRWHLAEECAAEVLRLNTGSSVIPIPALIAMSLVKARRGDPEAAAWLEKADHLAQPTGELQRIGPLAAARAEYVWWQGKPEQIEAVVQQGYELAFNKRDPWILGQLAYWLWRSGKHDIPLEYLAEPYQMMIQGEWQAAARAWDQIGFPFEQALALSHGDPSARIAALEIFERLGAQPAAKMLKNEMRQQGDKGIPRGPRPATRQNSAGLTTRELEILALVAEGLTNADIASRLSISKKTADHHVSALLNKLDATNRSQALNIARRQGLLP